VINTEQIKKLKESSLGMTVAKSVIPALILALGAWCWNTEGEVRDLKSKMAQDKAQWNAIRQISERYDEQDDRNDEQEIRLRVAEKIQEWSVRSGIMRAVAEDVEDSPQPAARPRLDVGKMFDKLKQERSREKESKKDLDRYIHRQIQQQEMAK